MSRLDLVEASLLQMDKKCVRRGDRITAQCPAHDDREPSFVASTTSDDAVLFHCYAGCSGASIMEALGLRWDQIKPHDRRQQMFRRPRDPSYDECVCGIAEADMRQGKRLNQKDLQTYRQSLLRQHRSAR